MEQRVKNQRLIIIASAGGIILISVLGGADASLLQLFALDIMELGEKEIGLVIGISALAFPVQFMGIGLVQRWGAKKTSKTCFALLFFMLPALLLVPMWQQQDAFYGYAFFCVVILVMNMVHHIGKGVSWQYLIREATMPAERGRFFANMRLIVNSTSLLFFGVLGIVASDKVSLQDYSWIVAFLMAYCIIGFVATSGTRAISVVSSTPSVSGSNFLLSLKKVFHNRSYTTLIAIMVLSSLPSLPLLVTYVSTRLDFQADRVSQLMGINVAGTIAGLLIWGRLIDRLGFKKVLKRILLLLACIGPLWLLVYPTMNHADLAFLTIATISVLTTFLYSGLKISLLVGVHNTIKDDTAIVSLAIFNMILGFFFSMLAVFMGLYLEFTGTWKLELGVLVLDGYQLISIVGALLCGVCIILNKRIAAGG